MSQQPDTKCILCTADTKVHGYTYGACDKCVKKLVRREAKKTRTGHAGARTWTERAAYVVGCRCPIGERGSAERKRRARLVGWLVSRKLDR